ncbi:BZ3500_MvSof-1268-A1-R1_Chr2-2g05154 [Microbotryum saponariae]|uniref:BZ3500_MvSof-1268-A1-R1_Chr2-2g05154 protein n=1 Tax=Microbotryum saponariae TaxID=289078 RepID=A0A2X0K8V8_9BASI|nr:BZ3500_MvSof-1268-A1-R1_Chr2-2g05154 [Microbotryum saponariae]SDA00981.1 BZ3501_MvSof-1269-A2-R1_Chr2-2g04828 [Microbotryum saponariae]
MVSAIPFVVVVVLVAIGAPSPAMTAPVDLVGARVKRSSARSPVAEGILDIAKRSTIWSGEPIAPVEFISYWPAITSPLHNQVLNEGESFELAWNNTLPPCSSLTCTSVDATNQYSQNALLLLGYISPYSEGLHLDVDHPLGINISLYNGANTFTFTLPTNLTTRNSYVLVLGSTSNAGPPFTIRGTGPADPEASETASSTTGRMIEALPTTYILGGVTTVVNGPSTTTAAAPTAAGPTPAPGSTSARATASPVIAIVSSSSSTATLTTSAAAAESNTTSRTSSAHHSTRINTPLLASVLIGLGYFALC